MTRQTQATPTEAEIAAKIAADPDAAAAVMCRQEDEILHLRAQATATWRQANHLTDWEFAEVGVLLCDHDPRDLAAMVVRLRATVRDAAARKNEEYGNGR